LRAASGPAQYHDTPILQHIHEILKGVLHTANLGLFKLFSLSTRGCRVGSGEDPYGAMRLVILRLRRGSYYARFA
ncbi:MAG TPA: hypothetical protein VKP65_09880, partial [Rhodothermales bacterium]|nr:hypothetical protein [Rhodothermales bacterium]